MNFVSNPFYFNPLFQTPFIAVVTCILCEKNKGVKFFYCTILNALDYNISCLALVQFVKKRYSQLRIKMYIYEGMC